MGMISFIEQKKAVGQSEKISKDSSEKKVIKKKNKKEEIDEKIEQEKYQSPGE